LLDGLDRLHPVSVTRIKATFFAIVYMDTTGMQDNYIEHTIYFKKIKLISYVNAVVNLWL